MVSIHNFCGSAGTIKFMDRPDFIQRYKVNQWYAFLTASVIRDATQRATLTVWCRVSRPLYVMVAAGELEGAAAVAEVEALHAFFVRWFMWTVPETETEFERFSSALVADFEMVVPSGARLEREAVLSGVRQGYGQWRGDEGSAIEVREAKARPLGGGLVQVSYEEWQRRGGEWKARRSVALLRRTRERGIQWVYVHETWIANAG